MFWLLACGYDEPAESPPAEMATGGEATGPRSPPRVGSSLRSTLEDAVRRVRARSSVGGGLAGWPKGADGLTEDCGTLESFDQARLDAFRAPALNDDALWPDPEGLRAAAAARAEAFQRDPLGFADQLVAGGRTCGGLAFELAAGEEVPERDEVRYPAWTASGGMGTASFHVTFNDDVVVVEWVDLTAVVAAADARNATLIAQDLAALTARLQTAPTLDDLLLLRNYNTWRSDPASRSLESSAGEAIRRALAAVPPPVRLGKPKVTAVDFDSAASVSVTNIGAETLTDAVVGVWIWRPGTASPLIGSMCTQVSARAVLRAPLAPGATALATTFHDAPTRVQPGPLRVEAELLQAKSASGALWRSSRLVEEIPPWCWY